MDGNGTAENGCSAAGGGPSDVAAPPSRSRQVAARAVGPTPEGIGELTYAAALDAITGAVDTKQVNTMCRAIGTFTNVARNAEPIGELCDGIKAAAANRQADQAAQARQRRVAELKAELAALESAPAA